jgi:DNA mismatch endonuclease (patch repair protein)
VLLPIQHFVEAERSEVMARIRSRGNRDAEVALARLLRANGITGWRRQQVVRIHGERRRARTAEAQRRRRRGLRQSRPTNVGIDFLFPKQRVAVFVDGCFWHGCPVHSPPARWLAKSTMPVAAGSRKASTARRSGKQFWRAKLTANQQRDRFVNRQLRRQGWRVVRIWEHELVGGSSRHDETAQRLLRKIRAALAGRAVRLCR